MSHVRLRIIPAGSIAGPRLSYGRLRTILCWALMIV